MDDLVDRRPVRRARATVRAKIKEKREVAKGTLLVVFDLLGERFDYRAGQYFWVELLDPPYQDGKGPRRHISAVTSPTERGVIGLCTRVRDSAFKRSLAELPVGVEVEVEPPRGKFVLPETRRARSSSSPAGSASPPSGRCFATSRTKGSRTGLR